MNNQLQTKYDIMSRVKMVRGMRTLLSSPVASGLFGIALACYLSIIVSLGDIFSNTMIYVNWSERFSYAFSSLLHSRIIVQTLAVLIVVASFAVLINSLRKIPVRRVFSYLKISAPFGSTQQI